jgi:hypothetical protein
MWEYEHSVETVAEPAAVWRRYVDVAAWGAWDSSVERIEAHGPFAVGTEISLTPVGQDQLRMRLTEILDGEGFSDETAFGDLTVRFIHRLTPLPGRGTRVTHRIEVDGPGAEHVGPAITSDTPEAMAGLVKLAEED